MGCANSSSAKVQNCYSRGKVTCTVTGNYSYAGGIIGKTYSKSPGATYINSNAYLAGSAGKGIGYASADADGYNSFESSDISGLLTTIGDAYQADLSDQINGGYPILRWQNPNAKFKASFTVKDKETNLSLDGRAKIEVKNSSKEIVSAGDDGYELSPGEYSYTVTRDGYTPVSDSFTIGKSSKAIEVALTSVKHDFTLTVSPAAAEVKITNDGGAPSDTCKLPTATVDESTGIATYKLSLADTKAYGAYKAEAKCYEYVEQSGITLDATGEDDSATITLAAAEKHKLTVTTIPSDAKVYITNTKWDKKSTESEAVVDGKHVFSLIDGDYSCKVKASGYKTESKDFTMDGKDDNLGTITLGSKTAWDGSSVDTDWYTNNPSATNFEISEPEELAGLAVLVNGSDTAIGTVDFKDKTISLTKDIDLGGKEANSNAVWTGWTTIGKTDNKLVFKGTFNGNGHKVKNLYINVTNASGSTNAYGGLFGRTNDAVIENLSLENASISVLSRGSSTGYQHVGALVGRAVNTTVRNIIVTAEEGRTSEVSAALSSSNYIGGIFGSLAGGSAVDCVNKASVTGGYLVGGIAGGTYSGKATTFLRCVNYGALKSLSDGISRIGGTATATFATGGIVGQLNNAKDAVKNCVNYGAISGANPTMGGIVGCNASSSYTQSIDSCYNLNSVSTTCSGPRGIGGIIGYVHAGNAYSNAYTGITNCYSAGVLTGAQKIGGVAGHLADNSVVNSVIYNNYYLENDSYAGANNGSGKVENEAFTSFAKTDVNATLISNLGSAYGPYVDGLAGCEANKTEDVEWPILRWQNPGSTYEASFTFTYDDESNKSTAPVVKVTSKNDPDTVYIADENGKCNLPNGTYTYEVSCDGYNAETPESGVFEFTVDQDAVTVEVSLKAKTCAYSIVSSRTSGDKFSFSLSKVTTDGDKAIENPEGVDTESGDAVIATKYDYALTNGTYKYTAIRFGYEKLTGTFVVAGEETNTLNLAYTPLATGSLGAEITPESGSFAGNDPKIELYAVGGDFDGQMVAQFDNTSSIYSGSVTFYAGTYDYKIKADGYTTVEGQVKIEAGATTCIQEELPVKTGWGGDTDVDTDWYTNDTGATEYTLTNVSQLAGVAKLVNDGTTTFSGKTIKLACDMDLADNAWTPIGGYVSGGAKKFEGTFDGQGHVVTMRNAQMEKNEGSFGLFGWLRGATVENVVLQGNAKVDYVEQSSAFVLIDVGALAGYAESSVIVKCSNRMSIDVKIKNENGAASANVAGLIGRSSNLIGVGVGATSFSACNNIGMIEAQLSAKTVGVLYAGGLVGNQNDSNCSVNNCYNTGDITVSMMSGATATANAGGLIGGNRTSGLSVSNCYGTGKVAATAISYYGGDNQTTGDQKDGALVGSSSYGTFSNSYYLSTMSDSTAKSTKKTDTEMKAAEFVTALNDGGNAYVKNPNRGYPILSWEAGIDHIAVTTNPDKVDYNDLEDFDDTGMKITAYTSGDDSVGSEVVSGWSISGGKKLAAGTSSVTVKYKGATVELPITVTAVDHEITSGDLELELAAPQAGATPQGSIELSADQQDKFSAQVSWTCAGKDMGAAGTFEEGKFYRAHVTLKNKYEAGVLQWVFANGAWPNIGSAYEILNYTQTADKNGKLAITEFDVTFAPVGYTGSIEPNMFHSYYAGDTGDSGKAYDLGASQLKVTIGNKAAEPYTVADIEEGILDGDISVQKRTVDGTEYLGIDLLTVLEAAGVPRTVADDTSITFSNASGTGDVTLTYGELRQQASDDAAIVAFANATDAVPLGSGTGPLMLISGSTTRTCLGSIAVDEPASAATQKVSFSVDANDGSTVESQDLDISLRDGYGHKFYLDTSKGMSIDVRDGDTYSYRVTKDGYDVVTGSVKVSGKDKSIKVTLSPVWDGVTTSKPSTADDGFIEIGTAAELMWWHDNYNASDKVRLTNDISLNDGEDSANVWDVLGTNSGYSGTGTLAFSGTFDGNGHVIRNILIQRENTYELELAWDGSVMAFADRVSEIGLFGYTGGSAQIKNLGVEGTIDIFDRPDGSLADWLQVGGIVGLAQGSTKISGCYTNMAIRAVASTETDTVGGYPTGGFGYVTDIYMGGIAGSLSGNSTVDNCYTKGTYIGAETRQVTIGGVVGALRYGTNSVTNCYSTANIDARPLTTSSWASWLGGVVGVNYNNSSAPVRGSYALNGSIAGNSVHMTAGKVIARAQSGALSGNYALDTMTITGAETSSDTGANTVNGLSITLGQAQSGKAYGDWSEDLWTFADAAGEGILPMLAWQTTQAGENKTIEYTGQTPADTDDDDWDGYFGSQSAPPYFKVYARVGDKTVVLKKFTRDEMKQMAAADNQGVLYYSSISTSGYAGRAVKEYVTIDTLLEEAGVTWKDGDAIIMGGYLYPLSALTAERYYYPDWTSGSSEGAVPVKPVIALKSNGAKSGMSKELFAMYGQQADYLYAYMLTFGQSTPTEASYGYFMYQQTQMGVNFKPASTASETLTNYLGDLIAQAEADRDATYVSNDGSDVAGSDYYVSQDDMDTFNQAINVAKAALANTGATNEDAMNAITALISAQKTFDKAKQQGKGVNRVNLSNIIEKASNVAYNAKVSVDGSDVSVSNTWATQEAINALKAAISDAHRVYYDQGASQAQLDQAARTLQAALSSFKVDKGTKEVAYRNAKASELREYAAAIDQSKLTSYQKQKVADALSEYVAKINAAQSVEGIDDAFNAGKAAIDAAATAKQDGGQSGGQGGGSSTTDIAKAKADAKAALQAAVDNSGLTGTDKEAVQKIANDYSTKIDEATTSDEVSSTLSAGKSAIQSKIDQLKLDAAKAQAKTQLEAYAKEKGAGYADQDALQKVVDAALALINSAKSTAEVDAQLAAGKTAIDSLVSGGVDNELARAKANAKAELSELLTNASISEDAKADVRDIMADYVIEIDAANSVSVVNKLLVAGRGAMEAYIDFANGGTASVTASDMAYKLVYKTKTATLVKLTGKAKTAKSIKVPATVSYCGITYKVTGIASKACAKQVKATTMTLGKNVKSVKAKAIYGCKKLGTVIVKSKKLTKASVKNLVKSTKVKVIKVKVSKKKAVNKKFAVKYGKWAKAYSSKVAVK